MVWSVRLQPLQSPSSYAVGKTSQAVEASVVQRNADMGKNPALEGVYRYVVFA